MGRRFHFDHKKQDGEIREAAVAFRTEVGGISGLSYSREAGEIGVVGGVVGSKVDSTSMSKTDQVKGHQSPVSRTRCQRIAATTVPNAEVQTDIYRHPPDGRMALASPSIIQCTKIIYWG